MSTTREMVERCVGGISGYLCDALKKNDALNVEPIEFSVKSYISESPNNGNPVYGVSIYSLEIDKIRPLLADLKKKGLRCEMGSPSTGSIASDFKSENTLVYWADDAKYLQKVVSEFLKLKETKVALQSPPLAR